MQRNPRPRNLFPYLIIILLSVQSTGLLHSSHGQTAPTSQNLSWTDSLSGGLWARMNQVGNNHTILDPAQARAMFGSLVPSVSSPQPSPSPFTNNYRVTGNLSLFPVEDEPSIAVTNQTGRFLMVVGANSLSTNQMVAYYSKDQGTQWTGPTLLPLSRGNDTFASDPALGVDRTGRFYYGFLSISSSIVFASGGEDDVVVATSPDGITWTNHVAVQRTSSGSITTSSELFDKDYLAVGPSKTNNSADEVYVTYTDFKQGCSGIICTSSENVTIMEVHSTDLGVTWSPPVPVSPTLTVPPSSRAPHIVQGSIPAVASNGDLYVAYYDSGADGWLNGTATIMVSKSTDGGNSFSPPTQAAQIPQELTLKSGGNLGFRWWSSMFPSMDIAPSGTVYIAYGARQSTYSPDPADVYLVSSSDGAASWNQPRKINDDTTQKGQFFAWLKVAGDGIVHIIWGDQRLDPVGLGYDIYYAQATNQGTVITANTRVTDVGTDPQFTVGFVGDYFNLAVSGNQVYPIWTDGRRGIQALGRGFLEGETDIYTARLGPRDTPSITISTNTPAGYLAPAPISGSGLSRESFFVMRINGVGLLSQNNAAIFFFSDKTGSLTDILLPNINFYGSYTVELDEWLSGAQLATTTLNVVDTRSLQVLVTGPSTASPSDTVTWNLQLAPASGSLSQGSSTSITLALLTPPNGQAQDLTSQVKSTGPGSYSLSTILPGTATAGSYTLSVNASETGPTVWSTGRGVAALTVGSSLSTANQLNMLQIYTGIVGGIAALAVALQVLTLTGRKRTPHPSTSSYG